MSEIPTISVTKDDENSYDNLDNGDFDVSGLSGALTDIEDMDSNDEEEFGKLFLKNNNNRKGSRSVTATDIEDYNDSCSEDEASKNYPVLKLSLQEFLNHGITEERTRNNRFDGTCEMTAGNLLGLESFTKTDDCPTDYDNYSLSSDDEHYEEKSVCLDFSLMHLDNKNTEDHVEHVEKSDKESDEDISRSDCIDYFSGATAGCVSEDEVIEVSGNEEEMLVAVSSSDDEDSVPENYPTIGVKFTSEGKKKKREAKPTSSHFLQVSANCEESLTDIEKIDLSAAEDSGDENSIPIARAIVIDSTENSNTDIEDMTNLSEATKFSEEIDNYNLPPPHREMVLIQEDKNGDPITNVVAMENDFHFGLADAGHDDLLTDIEDISSALDDINDFSNKEVTDLGSTFENEFSKSSENMKTSVFKRNDYLDNLTDTEEIFMSGSVRRKKNKLKTQNKSKSKQNSLHVCMRRDSLENCESDESNISSRNQENPNQIEYLRKQQAHTSNNSSTAEIYNNESFTVVHEKCINMFNVQKERNYIKGMKECLDTHTDVEYVEVDQIRENQ